MLDYFKRMILGPQDGPSITALSVLLGKLRATRHEKSYAESFGEEDLFLSQYLYEYARAQVINQWGIMPLFTRVVTMMPEFIQNRFLSWLVKDGYDHLMATRKAMVKKYIDQAVEKGVEQVVLLAGGYDPRGLLAAKAHPNLKVFEIDRGVTRQVKIAALEQRFDPRELGDWIVHEDGCVSIGDRLHFVECSLPNPELKNMLEQHGFDSTKKTLFFAEGLTMYMTFGQVKQLFTDIGQSMCHDSELIVGIRPSNRHRKALSTVCAAGGEGLDYGQAPEEVNPFVKGCDLHVSHRMTTRTWNQFIADGRVRAHYHNPMTLPMPYYVLKRGAKDVDITEASEPPVFKKKKI